MSARFGLRAVQAFRQPAARQNVSSNLRFMQKRGQSTAAEAAEAPSNESALMRLWKSPIGPKTVHFWAPVMKWGLVLAGAADFTRPASQLSISQNAALMATGLIWTRWCFVIKPRNLFLASVNFLVFCTGTTQVTRVLMYRQSLKASGEELKQEAKEDVKEAEGLVEKVVQKGKDAVGAK